MELKSELKSRKDMIDSALDQIMPDENTRPKSIHQAMRYVLFNGGKRLRPILVLEGAGW